MSLFAVLMSSLRVLFGTACMLLALGMVALAMMFGGRTMCLGSVVVMFGSLVMFVFGHGFPRWLSAPSRDELAVSGDVPNNRPTRVAASKISDDGRPQFRAGMRPTASPEAPRAQ